MSPALEDELATALAIIAKQHEIITCWRTMHLPGELHFVPLPADMWAIITGSLHESALCVRQARTNSERHGSVVRRQADFGMVESCL